MRWSYLLSAGFLLLLLLLSRPLSGQAVPAALPSSFAYPAEFTVEIRTNPRVVRPGDIVQLEITVRDPSSGRSVMSFLPTHGQLFHVYMVSDDPSFVHQHAAHDARGFMRVDTLLPRAGLYRILTQFHPDGAQEQFAVSSIVVGGTARTPSQPETPTNSSGNGIQIRSDPANPHPAAKTMLFFTLDASDKLEKFEGEWGQLLVISDDLIDVIRVEPFPPAPGGPGHPVQFNLYFPRARTYRVWAQFRIDGETETASFDVAVKPY